MTPVSRLAQGFLLNLMTAGALWELLIHVVDSFILVVARGWMGRRRRWHPSEDGTKNPFLTALGHSRTLLEFFPRSDSVSWML